MSTSTVDGVHLDAKQHQILGLAMAGGVLPALTKVTPNSALHPTPPPGAGERQR